MDSIFIWNAHKRSQFPANQQANKNEKEVCWTSMMSSGFLSVSCIQVACNWSTRMVLSNNTLRRHPHAPPSVRVSETRTALTSPWMDCSSCKVQRLIAKFWKRLGPQNIFWEGLWPLRVNESSCKRTCIQLCTCTMYTCKSCLKMPPSRTDETSDWFGKQNSGPVAFDKVQMLGFLFVQHSRWCWRNRQPHNVKATRKKGSDVGCKKICNRLVAKPSPLNPMLFLSRAAHHLEHQTLILVECPPHLVVGTMHSGPLVAVKPCHEPAHHRQWGQWASWKPLAI